MSRIRRAHSALTREYPVKVWQWIGVITSILILVFGGIYGAVIYVDDQADAAQQSADQASYENARDESTRCEQRVESRAQIRGAFLDVYTLIDDISPDNSFTMAARTRLEETYPPLSLSECPPTPARPVED